MFESPEGRNNKLDAKEESRKNNKDKFSSFVGKIFKNCNGALQIFLSKLCNNIPKSL